MTVATALVAGNEPLPQLVEEAVASALDKAGLTHANGVLLFLTPDFARHAQQSVTAAARRAQCTQIAGGIAAGVFAESGWVLDRPAAAVMVFGNGLSLGHPDLPDATGKTGEPVLSYTGSTFPAGWSEAGTRFGGSFTGTVGHADPVAWQQGRLAEQQRCSVQLLGAHLRIGISSGLRLLGDAQTIDSSTGYDLNALGGLGALDSLQRALPAEFRALSSLPLQHLTAVLIEGRTGHRADDTRAALADGRYRPVPIIAANADHSVTLSERTHPGQQLAWAIRQPLSAETEMRQTVCQLADETPDPLGALVFSCIGRGPYFYGGEDRDLDILRERFPGMPLLGTYGTGQIAPGTDRQTNRQLQNAVVTALITRSQEESHVQPIA